MFEWLKKYWIVLVIVGFLIVIVDTTISSMWTCHPPPEGATNSIKNQYVGSCSNLHGPFLSSAGWLVSFMDRHEGFFVGLFTAGLAVFTAALWRSTDKLWAAGERQLSIAESAAATSRDQLKIMAAVEGPIPIFAEMKLVQFKKIPGEDALGERLPPGIIPPHCRIIFAIENKGRTPLRMLELCIEKFIGTALPDTPKYANKTTWHLVLEKGPVWIRADDSQIVITAGEIGKLAAGGSLWVYGYFTYLNLLDERREHKFIARWDLTKGFLADNRAGYL